MLATKDYYQSNAATNGLVKHGWNDKNIKSAG